MLGPDNEPLARRYYSEKTGQDLDDEQMVRGFEIDKDKYVIVTDEELERLAPEQSRDIDLRRFVDLESIPPLYLIARIFWPRPPGPKSLSSIGRHNVAERTGGHCYFCNARQRIPGSDFPGEWNSAGRDDALSEDLRSPKMLVYRRRRACRRLQ